MKKIANPYTVSHSAPLRQTPISNGLFESNETMPLKMRSLNSPFKLWNCKRLDGLICGRFSVLDFVCHTNTSVQSLARGSKK